MSPRRADVDNNLQCLDGDSDRPAARSLTDELSTVKQPNSTRKHAASEKSGDGSILVLYPSQCAKKYGFVRSNDYLGPHWLLESVAGLISHVDLLHLYHQPQQLQQQQ